MLNSSQPSNEVCRPDPSFTFSDCTQWSKATVNSLTTSVGVSQFLTRASVIGSTCVERVNEIMESVYRVENEEKANQQPPNQECITNCVLVMRNERTCESSVMLLEQAYRLEAMKAINDLLTVNGSQDLCSIDLVCCGMSEPLLPICTQRKYKNSKNICCRLTRNNYGWFKCVQTKL